MSYQPHRQQRCPCQTGPSAPCESTGAWQSIPQEPQEGGDKEVSGSADLSSGTPWCVYMAAASVAVLAAPLQFSPRNMDVKIDLGAWLMENRERVVCGAYACQI